MSFSVSVAATGSPMSRPVAVFSATPRVVVGPSSKVGGVLGARVTVAVRVCVGVLSAGVTSMVITFGPTSSGTDAPFV